MALGSHFSPVPYSLIKAWSFAPQPPSKHQDIGLILRHPVNRLRHGMACCRHWINAAPGYRSGKGQRTCNTHRADILSGPVLQSGRRVGHYASGKSYPSAWMTAPRPAFAARLLPSRAFSIRPSPKSWNAAAYTPSAPIFAVMFMPRDAATAEHMRLSPAIRCGAARYRREGAGRRHGVRLANHRRQQKGKPRPVAKRRAESRRTAAINTTGKLRDIDSGHKFQHAQNGLLHRMGKVGIALRIRPIRLPSTSMPACLPLQLL